MAQKLRFCALGFDPNIKRDWTSAGAPNGTLPSCLFATRPTVMSLMARTVAKMQQKNKQKERDRSRALPHHPDLIKPS